MYIHTLSLSCSCLCTLLLFTANANLQYNSNPYHSHYSKKSSFIADVFESGSLAALVSLAHRMQPLQTLLSYNQHLHRGKRTQMPFCERGIYSRVYFCISVWVGLGGGVFPQVSTSKCFCFCRSFLVPLHHLLRVPANLTGE